MKKINLKGISEILTEKELKNVMGGSSVIYIRCIGMDDFVIKEWESSSCPSTNECGAGEHMSCFSVL